MADDITPEFLIGIAGYADLSLTHDRAERLARFLDPAVRKLRSIRLEGYEYLQPALSFHLPVPPPDPEK
jgi:hypothetical protein